MTEFKREDSLGAKPLTQQVAYLQLIGDPDAKAMINDMIRFAPKIGEMKTAVADYIKNPNVPYEERVRVWFETPRCLMTLEDYLPNNDEAIERLIPDWIQRVAQYRREEVDLREIYITGDEYGLEEIDMDKIETVGLDEYNQVPKVIVDFCLKEGIHGFINDW